MGLAWILGIFLLIGFLGSIFSGSPDSGQPSDGAVYLTATRIIQKRLTSPATAKFPSFYEDGAVNFTSLGGNDYQIDSYVDSQNAFGAMVRTRYRAKIKVDGDRVALTDFDTK